MCFGNKLNQNRPEHCITPFPTPNNLRALKKSPFFMTKTENAYDL